MRLALVLLAFASAASTQAALPPLAYFGNLRGDIALPGLPQLTWTLAAPRSENHRQSAGFTLIGEGFTLRARVDADEKSGSLSWRIIEGRVVLDQWLTPLVARYAAGLGPLSATGELAISGEGTLAGFAPTGVLALACQNVSVKNTDGSWALDDVDFSGAFALGDDAAIASAEPFTLRIQTITTGRFGARAFLLNGRLIDLNNVLVESAGVEIAGGRVDTVSPFNIALSPFETLARVRVARIGLQDFVQLIPSSGLAEARGRLDGELRVGWNEAAGLQLGIGHLMLDEVEPTILRLAPSPGLLTASIPASFSFLPGRIGRWLSLRNDGYYDLRDIELGLTELRVDSMRLSITPDGDEQGRSARIEIEATPLQPGGAVPKVHFTVNVAGPLAALLHLGLTEDFSTELR